MNTGGFSRTISRYPIGLAAVVAFIVTAPSLRLGFDADDHLLRLAFYPDSRLPVANTPPWHLFRFFDANSRAPLIESGVIRWWTSEDCRVEFFRPTSALFHQIDFLFWPQSPALMHLVSVLWYVSVVIFVTKLYQAIMGPTSYEKPWHTVMIAGIMFALDATHAVPIAWLSNRNALIAASLGVLSLLLYHHARQQRNNTLLVLSAAVLPIALGAGEAALGLLAYYLSYSLFIDTESFGSKLKSLSMHGVVVAIWLAMYKMDHYGVSGSSLYYDPLRSPKEYLINLVERAPLLVSSELGMAAPELWGMQNTEQRFYWWCFAMMFLCWSLFALIPILRNDNRARFFAAGAVMSILPVCATFPSARLLLIPSIGFVGLITLALQHAKQPSEPSSQETPPIQFTKLAKGWIYYIVFLHIILAPLFLIAGLHQIHLVEIATEKLAQSIPESPYLAEQQVIVFHAPYSSMYVTSHRLTRNMPTPKMFLNATSPLRDVSIKRQDPHTLRISVVDGFYKEPSEMLTAIKAPRSIGETSKFNGLSLTVTKTTEQGTPNEALFSFEQDLDTPYFQFLRWDGGKLTRIEIPQLGDTIILPACNELDANMKQIPCPPPHPQVLQLDKLFLPLSH